MKEILCAGAGGFIGAVLRYKLSGAVLHHTVNWKFPASTFLVNVLGCLAAGVLSALIVKHDSFTPVMRVLIITGVLGGFTTFSAFGVETVYLIERHAWGWAGLYVASTIAAGMGVLWLGMALIK